MRFYENIELERDRVQACINKFGWTSDHNLDWFLQCVVDKTDKPVFVEFDDGSGLLAHQSSKEWSLWSDPLCRKDLATDKISEFASSVLSDQITRVWCRDVSDTIYPKLKSVQSFRLDEVYYSLEWPILDMEKYVSSLPGGHFKDIRNAKNKFYKEHKVWSVNSSGVDKGVLHKLIDGWKNFVKEKDDYYDSKYHNAVDNNFGGFLTARALIVDDRVVGINAGYDVINNPERFAGVIGIHDYSIKELGLILWLEDFEWVKKSGYKEMDLQGDEGGGLQFKMQFNPTIERKTDTFSIKK